MALFVDPVTSGGTHVPEAGPRVAPAGRPVEESVAGTPPAGDRVWPGTAEDRPSHAVAHPDPSVIPPASASRRTRRKSVVEPPRPPGFEGCVCNG